MVDQLEFAQVIVLNKIDMVEHEELEKVKALIKTLNPTARLLPCNYSKIDLREILDTNLFDYSKAALSMGWLRSLSEEVKPETEEYGVGTFVYRARRPFAPLRLWKAIREVFVVIQTEYIDDGEDGEEDSEMKNGEESEAEDEKEDKEMKLNPDGDAEEEQVSSW